MPTTAALTQSCDRAIERLSSATQAIVRVREAQTFSTVIVPLERAFADANDALAVDRFAAGVSTDGAVRAASARCDINARAALKTLESQPALYRAVVAAAQNDSAQSDVDRALGSAWLLRLRGAGAAVGQARRSEFLELESELTDLESQFQRNLAQDDSSIAIGRRHETLAVNDGTADFLASSNDEAARHAFWTSYENRAWQVNVPIFERTLAVRDRLAHVLGYQSWADYRLADTMAESPMRVEKFLSSAVAGLRAPTGIELEAMRGVIASEQKRSDVTLEPWDVPRAQYLLRHAAVDDALVRQYFPAQPTFDAALRVCHTLFGVDFTPLAAADLWSPDVTAYQVTDSLTGTLLGYTYADLYARPGKDERFGNVTLLPARAAGGARRAATTAILGNWSRAQDGDPVLLSHGEVLALFGALAENLAALLATAPYETLNDLPGDFSAVPSHVFEDLAWQPAVLAQITSNVRTGEAMPPALIDKLVASRGLTSAYATTRSLVLATLDIHYHSDGDRIDSTALWANTASALLPTLYAPGVHPQVAFDRWMDGDDVRTYVDAWSQLYADDLFTAFAPDPLDPAVGMRFRGAILAPTPGEEPDLAIANFLGRPMNPDAFFAEFTR